MKLYIDEFSDGIVDEEGNLIAEYSYDRRQELYISHVRNPLFYKGFCRFYAKSEDGLLIQINKKLSNPIKTKPYNIQSNEIFDKSGNYKLCVIEHNYITAILDRENKNCYATGITNSSYMVKNYIKIPEIDVIVEELSKEISKLQLKL